ncbi:hypothetical protein DUNSADRAFT_5259, partial [Dunaliella salina]
LSRTDTSITLTVDRKGEAEAEGVMLLGKVLFELHCKEAEGNHPWSILSSTSAQSKPTTFAVQGLDPGSKYTFRGRAGMQSIEQGKGFIWGGFSVDSCYVTSGAGEHHMSQLRTVVTQKWVIRWG